MAQQPDFERRIAEAERDIQKIEKAIWGNGGDGMKDKLNRIETQQRIMLKLGWIIVAASLAQIGAFILRWAQNVTP